MLYNARDLDSFSIHASDGNIGQVDRFYFDDESWTIRYMVVDTGNWLPGRLVLIAINSVDHIDWNSRTVWVKLTRDQVENAPGIELHRPVTRRHEAELIGYYGYPYYWDAAGEYGAIEEPATPLPEDSHLQSTHDVTGYQIEAADGEIGHVDDFLIDDETWTIRYVEVNTGNWFFGRRVLVSPQWIQQIDWKKELVSVGLKREVIRNAPKYDPSEAVTRDYERSLFDYYSEHLDTRGNVRYWSAKDG